MVHRYDLVLAGIAASLSGGALVGVITGLPVYYGIGLGAIPGFALMVDAIFLHPPTRGGGAGPTNGTGAGPTNGTGARVTSGA